MKIAKDQYRHASDCRRAAPPTNLISDTRVANPRQNTYESFRKLVGKGCLSRDFDYRQLRGKDMCATYHLQDLLSPKRVGFITIEWMIWYTMYSYA